jgi:hypothetical protein
MCLHMYVYVCRGYFIHVIYCEKVCIYNIGMSAYFVCVYVSTVCPRRRSWPKQPYSDLPRFRWTLNRRTAAAYEGHKRSGAALLLLEILV